MTRVEQKKSDLWAGLGDEAKSKDSSVDMELYPISKSVTAGPPQKNQVPKGPSFRWADEISISASSEKIGFRGKKYFCQSMGAAAHDMLAQYLAKISSSRAGDEQEAPHYLFANAKTSDEMLRFFERFGPISIDPESLRINPLPGNRPGIVIEATQSWQNVRLEHQIFESLLTLHSQALTPQPDLDRIVEAAVSLASTLPYWIDQFAAEMKAERSIPRLTDDPRWIWDSSRQLNLFGHVSAIKSACSGFVKSVSMESEEEAKNLLRTRYRVAAKLTIARTHQLICAFLNAFPPTITRFNGETVVAVSESVALGTRHLLYFMLRRDYLAGGRVAVCAWQPCSKWFRLEGKDSPCCPEHRLRYRQKKYYDAGAGKEKRHARYEAVKKSKRKKKRRA
jgi:hypothetical protein